MRKIMLPTLVLAFLYISPAFACVPCAETWDLSKTAKHADAIIIGKRITPKTPGEDRLESAPEYVNITVESVLKGDIEEKTIKAAAYASGVCPYGIVTPPGKSYVMFLGRAKDGKTYDSLNYSCAVRSLAVENNKVLTDNGPMDMKQFKQLIQ